jgi:hypothetical protein
MRIIALPLVRPSSSNKLNLTYYHFQMHDKGKGKGKEGRGGVSGVVKWATEKATGVWAGFGRGKEGSWQVSFDFKYHFFCRVLSSVSFFAFLFYFIFL